MENLNIKIAKHFVVGTWFVIWAYFALELLRLFIDFIDMFYMVRYIALLFSFVFGSKFGTKLLSKTNMTKKEIIIIGCKVPICSFFITVLILTTIIKSTILLNDFPSARGGPLYTFYEIFFSFMCDFISNIDEVKASAPVILACGMFAAVIMRYIFIRITLPDKSIKYFK